MRPTHGLALALLLMPMTLIPSGTASAGASHTLTASPGKGSTGTSVTLRYSINGTPGHCGSDFKVVFTAESKVIGRRPLRTDCTSRITWTVPSAPACPATLGLYAGVDAQQETVAVVGGTGAGLAFAKTCAKPRPTASPRTSPTASPKAKVAVTATRTPSAPPARVTPTASPPPTPTPVPLVPTAGAEQRGTVEQLTPWALALVAAAVVAALLRRLWHSRG